MYTCGAIIVSKNKGMKHLMMLHAFETIEIALTDGEGGLEGEVVAGGADEHGAVA